MATNLNATNVSFTDGTTLTSARQLARVWVTWNPQTNGIYASSGVSSVTNAPNSIVNFSTAFASGNYATLIGYSQAVNDGFARQGNISTGTNTTTSCQFINIYGNTTWCAIFYI